ncbi:hypothetical protein [Burkholderia pseudomallei]|uniref:hypothetical protein n=1 Tax=Burkholderia pseudomallei TaxID=28450 RepID=UPI000F055DC1|nr:hypothetical protein [Burkholderia pseudomallei]VBQ81196.1 Uncharacterised protein [Burkholderia pseudomallei]
MKPFDLEAAKRGEPMITREGRAVTEFHHFTTIEGEYPCVAIIDGESNTYGLNGKYWGNDTENYNRRDLFMAPRKHTVYVNVYGKRNDADNGPRSCGFDTEEEARANARVTTWPVAALAIAVEIEE